MIGFAHVRAALGAAERRGAVVQGRRRRGGAEPDAVDRIVVRLVAPGRVDGHVDRDAARRDKPASSSVSVADGCVALVAGRVQRRRAGNAIGDALDRLDEHDAAGGRLDQLARR